MRDFSDFMLNSTPYFLAHKYRQVVEARSAKEKVRYALQLYELGVRTLAIGLVLQYLVRDLNVFSSVEINDLIEERLPVATLGVWEEIFFLTLRAYAGRRERLFMRELYDFYLDDSSTSPRERLEKREAFSRLTQIEADIRKAPAESRRLIDWSKTWEEVEHLLEQIFSDFAFIARYHVIRPLEKLKEGYRVVSYVGEEPTFVTDPLLTTDDLKTDHLYLCKFNRDKPSELLDLYPLFMILDILPSEIRESAKQLDLAIYERYAHDQLYYLVARLWKIVPRAITVGEFVDLIFSVIQHVKQQQVREIEALSWFHFSEVAQRITRRRMANVIGKYQTELYIQRADILLAFEGFLESEKTGFVLVGKSGVGKSNFLISLLDDYQPSHPNLCFLVYNGAKLNPLEELNVAITRDFDMHLKIMRAPEIRRTETIWPIIDQIPRISESRVVLCIDAINESSNPKELLTRIDDLVQESAWPWLKIVVTCRTEAWKVIEPTVALAEDCYYRGSVTEDATDQLAIEMGGFKYSKEISIFDRQNELPTVYKNYATRFDVQTSFADLTPKMKEVLRDPLVMRLVMMRYRKAIIPKAVDPEDIYRDYVGYLLEQGHLDQLDLDFLMHEIMPIMINELSFSNKVTAETTAEHVTVDNRRLFDLIHDSTVLSTGNKVNQSFERLVFNEILVPPVPASSYSYEISFKYERFYDYFAGLALEQLVRRRGHDLRVYNQALESLRSLPYLWGPVRYTLNERIKEKRAEVVLALAYSTDPTQRKAVASALIGGVEKANEDTRRNVIELLEDVLCGRFSHDQLDAPTDQMTVGAKQVVVEVSGHLMLPSLLVQGGIDESNAVRLTAVRFIEKAWRVSPRVSTQALLELSKLTAKRTLGVPIPERTAIDTVTAASLLIFLLYYEDLASIKPLADVGKLTINTMLPFRLDGRFGKLFARFLFRFVLFDVALRFVRDIPEDEPMYIPANLEEIRAYFVMQESDRNLLLEVIKLFYEENGPLSDHIEIFNAAAQLNDGNINWAVVHLLARRGTQDPTGTLDIIEHIFYIQVGRSRPSYQAAFLLGVFGLILGKMSDREMAKSQFLRYERLIREYISITNCRVYYSREYITPPLTGYIETSFRLFKSIDHSFVHQLLSLALETRDWDLLRGYSRQLGVAGLKYPRLVLRTLVPFLTTPEQQAIEELGGIISRIHSSHPELVNEFLIVSDASTQLKTHITVSGSVEETSDLYQSGLASWLLDAVNSDSLRDAMVLLLGQMPSSKNDKDWYAKLFGYIINLIFQEPVLTLNLKQVDVGFKVLKNPWEER